jgi:copper(I)-binding protein
MPSVLGRGVRNRILTLLVAAAAIGGLVVVLNVGHASTSTANPEPTFPTASATLGSLRITGAYVPQPASPSVAAAYFKVTNAGPADTLVRVTSDVAAVVNVHESVVNGTTGSMVPLNDLPVPAGGFVALRPGGRHLMLMNPSSLKEGGFVQLQLTFAHAGAVSIRVPVVPLTAVTAVDANDGHDTHDMESSPVSGS